jgi:hypothetical protein
MTSGEAPDPGKPTSEEILMKKSIVLLVAAVAVAATRPAARERLGERVEPLVATAHLGPVEAARTMLEPVFRWKARGQLRQIRRQIEQKAKVGDDFPDARQFERYLQENQIAGSDADPWGSSFALVNRPGFVAIVSPGPDRDLNTTDDLFERFNPQQ